MTPIIKALIAGLALAATAGSLQAAMYKWVDADGNTHYSQYPPRDQEYKTVVPPPPPSSSAAEEQKRLEELLRSQAEGREAQQESAKQQTADKAEAERRRQNCATARDNLTKLTTGGRKMLVGPDGNAYYPSQEELEKKIQTARDNIKENCN